MKKIFFLAFVFLGGGPFEGFSENINANFADVDTTHPFYQSIDSLHESGFIQGYNIDGKFFFRSLQKVSRAEALKILLLSADIDMSVNESNFLDVPKGAWFEKYIATAKEKGFVKGFPGKVFHPHAQVIRADFLKMAALAFNVPIDVSEKSEKGNWFDSYFDFAELFKILEEDLDPQESLSRGELAEIIFRFSYVAKNNFKKPYTYSGKGSASYYNEGFAGKLTANGEIYDPTEMTSAHRTLPFGTRLKVWTNNPENFIIVRINDRGPYHSSRILDLSEKAFSMLAPISRGIIEVQFEVFIENQEEIKIPEEILPYISITAKNFEVPIEIKDHLQSTPENEKTKYIRSTLKTPIPVFEGTVGYLGKDFFPDVTLRDSFPKKIRTGSVMTISGSSHKTGYKKVTVFFQPIKLNGLVSNKVEQTFFTGKVSDKNFLLPISFLEEGNYQMGIVFDDQKKSRVAEIVVTKEGQRIRRLARIEENFTPGLEINLIPEEKKVRLTWESDPKRGQLTKFVFSSPESQEKSRTLYVENGLEELFLEYDFFENFVSTQEKKESDILLSVNVYGAESTSKTLNTQTTNWKKIEYKNFILVPGFQDSESEKISFKSFPRFPKTLDSITLSGKILDSNIALSEHVFFTTPNRKIRKIPVIMEGRDRFKVRVLPKEWGTHILEVISTEGEILFNRALYFSESMVLPVQPWKRILVKNTTSTSIRSWGNKWRKEYNVSALKGNVSLNSLAQKYANEMAEKNFISHTSPTGMTFEDRIKMAGLEGEFAENLSMGTTINIALSGLQDSASHFGQIISSKWKSIGIGIAKNEKEFFIVQIFGK